MPNPHLLIGPFIRREAVMSSRIENTQSGLDQLFLFEADKTESPHIPDVQELVNYVNAMEYGIKRLQHFEAIHPFVDGNGRIGRLLIIFLLIERGLLSQPLLYPSDFFEEHRDTYYELLLNVSQQGDWKAWLTFFLQGICQQSEDALLATQRLLALKEEYKEIATGSRVPRAVNLLIDHLFGIPIISISELVKVWKSTFPTIQRGVDYLVERGKLREMTGQQRNRVFVADEILNVIMTERTKSVSLPED